MTLCGIISVDKVNFELEQGKTMTNEEILKIAMAQSAVDLSADASDFEKSENVVVTSRESDGARRYLKLPFSCQLVSYGNNVVASVSPEFREIAELGVEEIEETYAFPTELFGDGEMFMLRTYGDSMIDIGIRKDDLIVVKKQNYANDGDIIVALVDGETTLKRFFKEGSKIILHPENKTMKDIIVKECDIQGVLVSCIKMY